MKKAFKMENLDCANCAAKMEVAIKKIPGVENVTISFINQKITIDAAEELFDEIIEKAEKACKNLEPDCRIIK